MTYGHLQTKYHVEIHYSCRVDRKANHDWEQLIEQGRGVEES